MTDALANAPLPNSALDWTHRLLQLGPTFFTRLHPTPVAAPVWAARNVDLLESLGWPGDVLSERHLPAFAGNACLPGADPLATVYSGHQFGVWAGQLGDGRALWLGEARSSQGPQEIQLKGAGRTPYSRMGDGRAVLRSSIREYLCSEAMHGLGIPTTRALCLVASPEPVRRETLETAAIVTRVAPSFLRFGHFEHFAARNDTTALRQLADHVIEHHLPESHARANAWNGNVYAGLLDTVQDRTAALLARWQAVGFCHGVMNTDNMSILGLTLDYGPFQFMDGFDPGHICNHSDHQGRYAFGRQPQVAYWNLYCLAQALLPLTEDQDLTVQVLERYRSLFPRYLDQAMRAKLGLDDEASGPAEPPGSSELVHDLLDLLAADKVDFTLFWRCLSQAMAADEGTWQLDAPHWQALTDLLLNRPALIAWIGRYRSCSQTRQPAQMGRQMLRVNPKFVLRNHLAEIAIQDAQRGDFGEIEVLQKLLHSPFDEHPGHEDRAALPPDWASHLEISCSS